MLTIDGIDCPLNQAFEKLLRWRTAPLMLPNNMSAIVQAAMQPQTRGTISNCQMPNICTCITVQRFQDKAAEPMRLACMNRCMKFGAVLGSGIIRIVY